MDNRNGLQVGDIVRLKTEKAKRFPRPLSTINGFLNGDPLKPGCECIHADLDERLEGQYVHRVDHLELAGAI